MDDIVKNELIQKFDEFFDAYYKDEIGDLAIGFPDKRSLLVDIKNLEAFEPSLSAELLEKPDDILEVANEALKTKLIDVIREGFEPHVRFFGQTLNVPLVQDVGAMQIGKLITLDGLVIKRSEIIPKVKIGMYKCSYCGYVQKVRVDSDPVPEICPQCKRKSMKQDNENSTFINMQKMAIQDPLEKLRGSTPTWQLEVWIEDDLVNTILPGDRIDITGVLRIRPRKNAKGKDEPTLFTTFLDTVSVIPKQKDFSDIKINDEEKREIEELAKDPKIFEKIASSIVSSVYGHNEIKQAIVLQLFGGTQGKTLVDGGLIRSDIHILLIGDPGSAKTRILQAVSKLVPKGIYVSGKSVTGGGMTAVAERDDFAEGGWTLKAGAMVLGNGGIVCIDEFDKISEEDRASLHEALESQTISVAKAGIIATFNAKTSVLAAANPKYGRFDPHIYPVEQFNIPPTLLSRFDLIFPIRDIMDEGVDNSIAKHILLQHQAAGAQIANISEYEQVEKPVINFDLLRKFIAYARSSISPRLTDEASKRIQEYYVSLRKIGRMQGATPITPRQIEGLIRLAEASAKTRLSNTVELMDADRAINLTEFMFKTLAVDSSGRVDIDVIMTNMPREKVDKLNTLLSVIKNLEEKEGSAKLQRVNEEATKEGLDSATIEKYLKELEKSGDIYMPKAGIVKVVKHESE
ncbi:MAG: minichromosome maintenance protein MCM [Candidatus Micrarchaeia archaeon]